MQGICFLLEIFKGCDGNLVILSRCYTFTRKWLYQNKIFQHLLKLPRSSKQHYSVFQSVVFVCNPSPTCLLFMIIKFKFSCDCKQLSFVFWTNKRHCKLLLIKLWVWHFFLNLLDCFNKFLLKIWWFCPLHNDFVIDGKVPN